MRECAIHLATAAGNLLLAHYDRLGRDDATQKWGFRRDWVSAAGLKAENFLIEGVPSGDDIFIEEVIIRSRRRRTATD